MCAGLAWLFSACTLLAADDEDARIAAFEHGLRPAVSIEGDPQVRWTIEERLAHWNVPGISVAVIRDGKIAWAKGYGVKQEGTENKIDADTAFSVGSMSKVATAAITLRLVALGKLDLNRDVNEYLTRWQVPDNEFTEMRAVTLRGIMSHSAGLTVHGFPDFQPGAKLPTVIDTLNGTKPAWTSPVRVFAEPGSRFQYSGGGITVEQLVIEELTGLAFPEAARLHVFGPLEMTRSTYENPLPASHGNIARAHNGRGEPTALPRGWESMPEMGASGLWTTPSDYARLIIALIESYQGAEGTFLSTDIARDMMTEVGRSRYGLGPALAGQCETRRFSHGGSNNSYKALMEGHLSTGNGLVVVTNGANGARLLHEVAIAIAAAEEWGPGFTHAATIRKLAISPRQLDEFAGVYRRQPAATVSNFRAASTTAAYRVKQTDKTLHFGREALVPVDACRFVFASNAAASVEFIRGYDGDVERLVVRSGGYETEAEKQP
jgi:CubicO group peptidase (beta-lactamase class C family)